MQFLLFFPLLPSISFIYLTIFFFVVSSFLFISSFLFCSFPSFFFLLLFLFFYSVAFFFFILFLFSLSYPRRRGPLLYCSFFILFLPSHIFKERLRDWNVFFLFLFLFQVIFLMKYHHLLLFLNDNVALFLFLD